jgi:hypothetical protein
MGIWESKPLPKDTMERMDGRNEPSNAMVVVGVVD